MSSTPSHHLLSLVGRLRDIGGAEVPVSLTPRSRLTLRARFGPQDQPINGARFEALTLDLPGGPVVLSACQVDHFEAESARLVFLSATYDCDALFTQGKAIDLCSYLDNLPIMLRANNHVSATFKRYCADLIYGMAVHQRFFDEQDDIYRGEDAAVREIAQRQLIGRHGPAFNRFFDEQLEQLEALVAPLPRQVYDRHATFFRAVTWQFIARSEFLTRTNLKPRGYAGDAQMMRMVYEPRYLGPRVFDQLLHYHPLTSVAAQAVRNRRKLVANHLASIASDAPRRFFSVACGPAWEVRDLFQSAADATRWEGVLLDQDPEALAAAQAEVEAVGRAIGAQLKIECVNDSVRTMLRTPQLAARFGTFDFIYSMGLFDYLTPPVARVVLRRLAALLRPGGVMLVGNYDVANPTRHYMAFWMDWVLYLRTEAELLKLADGLEGVKGTVTRDPTGAQLFLRLERAR